MPVTKSKGWREEFARFFENPSRESLRDLIRSHVGELNGYDFKREWPIASKVARHILGMANWGGGCLIVGVDEKEDKTFEPVGLDKLADKADIQKSLDKFLPTQLKYEILDFSFDESEYPKIIGRKFQILLVEDLPEYIPFIAKSDGDGIKENAICTRRGTISAEANYEELQEILNRRIKTGYSSEREFDLKRHLAELRILYTQVSRYSDPFANVAARLMAFPRNPSYPSEELEEFIIRMIQMKKNIIENLVLRQ